MSRRSAYIYSDALSRHVLREDHPFVPSRLRLAYELLESYHAFEESDALLVSPRPATEEEVASFHDKEYVAAVKGFSRGQSLVDPAIYNFSDYGDNPIYKGMYEASALAVGASLVAAEQVLDGEVNVAFNTSGGLHHAGPKYASGFCVFNDVAIAIGYLLKRGMRVAYVDIDVHHGDGVQDAFYDTDAVLTISLHESGQYLFPGTGHVAEMGTGKGKGYAVNLPLAPYTDDERYLWAFNEVVPPLIKAFNPDILVTQLGIDSHYLDPLAHLQLTTHAYTTAIEELGKLAPKWIALGGGGYEPATFARSITLAYGVMINKEWPNEIPADYRERYGLTELRDRDRPNIEESAKETAQRFAEASVQEIRKLIFPFHGI